MRRTDERGRRCRGGSIASRLIVGLTIAGAGVVFLLDNLGVVRAGELLRFWPVALIAIGLAHLMEQHRRLSGAIFIIVGLALLGRTLRWMELGPALGALFPLVLVFIGISLTRQALDRRITTAGSPAADSVRMLAIMGGNERRGGSQVFPGGELTAIMGACVLDLRGASLAGDEVTIDALAIWGGIEIRIPPDWDLDPRVMALLGGFDDRARRPESPKGTLVLRGTAVMGGIEVKN